VANELRVRTNFLGGLIEDNPLASGATVLNSAALAAVPAIGSTQHMPIILDPDGVGGVPEIAYITAHTAAATTATITKGQEGTAARAHERDTPWLHGPTIKDFDASGGGSGLIGFTSYNPVSLMDVLATSASFVDVDSTNLVVAFTGPPSGKVLVSLTAFANVSTTGNTLAWNVRSGSSDVTGTNAAVHYFANTSGSPDYEHRATHRFVVSGLTAGTSYSYKWGHARTSGSGTVRTQCGGNIGPAVMEVWAVNL
jgi:hypothetical protein